MLMSDSFCCPFLHSKSKKRRINTQIRLDCFKKTEYYTNRICIGVIYMLASNIFGALGIASTILIYQQKTRKGLILSKLLSDVLWFLHYFFLCAYSGAAIAVIGMVRELVFVNREKKWAKHPFWLVFFIGVSLGCAYFTWKGIFSIFPCIASAVSVISFWIGNPKLSRFMSYPISACMLTYDIAFGSVMGIINEIFTVVSSIIGFFRHDRRKGEKQ